MDTDNKIKQLYIDFDKSLTTLYTLYDQLPSITFLQTLTINPAQIMITKCDAEIITHVILLKDTSTTADKKIINLRELNHKKNEALKTFIEVEKREQLNYKKVWEEQIIPCQTTMDRIITETNYCESILHHIDTLLDTYESSLFREKYYTYYEIFNKHLQDKIDIFQSLLISEEYMNTIESEIVSLEKLLVRQTDKDKYEQTILRINKYENKMRLIDESLAQSNVNDIDKYYMNERKQILIDGISDTQLSIYTTSLLVEKTELLLDKNKCKKTYLTTFNEYIKKLIDCLQSNRFRIYSVD
jgi:hypothetical protein